MFPPVDNSTTSGMPSRHYFAKRKAAGLFPRRESAKVAGAGLPGPVPVQAGNVRSPSHSGFANGNLAVGACRLAQPALTGNAQCRDDRNTCSTEQEFVTRLLTTGSFLTRSHPFIGGYLGP
jgi:hypothetical protein